MDKTNGNSNYLDHSYNDKIPPSLNSQNSFSGMQNPKTLRANQKLLGMEENKLN